MSYPFEILEHTADTGIRASGATRGEAFANVARGMMSLMFPEGSVKARESVDVEVTGADSVELLIAWLHEIVYLFETRHLAFCAVEVRQCTEHILKASMGGEPFDTIRHGGGTEVKAVTWHGAHVKDVDGVWEVQVYLDL
jgi:protein archease